MTTVLNGQGETEFLDCQTAKLLPEVRKLASRVSLFDFGHGSNSFDLGRGERVFTIRENFIPDTISRTLAATV